MELLQFTDRGIYCPMGDFYIDPWKPVKRAVITHAHSDHARPGNDAYLCHPLTRVLLKARLGQINCQELPWNEPLYLNGVRISLHPAGHVIGSSQVRMEYQGSVAVVSGDYKVEDDGLSGRFEPLRCDYFVTESTFGLPIYQWMEQQSLYEEIRDWIQGNMARGLNSVLLGYSLGKAQRLLQCASDVSSQLFLHGSVWNIHQPLVEAGIHLPAAQKLLQENGSPLPAGSVIIAPPGAEQTNWIKRCNPCMTCFFSGWMQVRGNQRRNTADMGFALSDHADWNGLLATVKETGAKKIYVTHGFQSAFSRFLREKGIDATEVTTEFGEEGPDPVELAS